MSRKWSSRPCLTFQYVYANFSPEKSIQVSIMSVVIAVRTLTVCLAVCGMSSHGKSRGYYFYYYYIHMYICILIILCRVKGKKRGIESHRTKVINITERGGNLRFCFCSDFSFNHNSPSTIW